MRRKRFYLRSIPCHYSDFGLIDEELGHWPVNRHERLTKAFSQNRIDAGTRVLENMVVKKDVPIFRMILGKIVCSVKFSHLKSDSRSQDREECGFHAPHLRS